MKLTKRIVFVGLSVMLVAQSSWAVRVKHAGQPIAPATSNTIERGGMITSIDQPKKTISVDGVSYPLSASVQNTPGLTQLKQGTFVRFTTEKDSTKSGDRVTDVRIATSPPSVNPLPRAKQ